MHYDRFSDAGWAMHAYSLHFALPQDWCAPDHAPNVAPVLALLDRRFKVPNLACRKVHQISEIMGDQVGDGDGGGAGGELQRLLEEGVSRCAAAGAGSPGPNVGRPGDKDSAARFTENELMTIYPGLVRARMGGFAAGGAPGGGQ